MRCYFNLEDRRSTILDEEGIEVADLAQARVQALIAATEVSAGEPDVQQWEGWDLKVVDTAGDVLFRLPLGLFTVTAPQGHIASHLAPSSEFSQEATDVLQNSRACIAAAIAH